MRLHMSCSRGSRRTSPRRSVPQAAGVSQVAAAFGVVAADGEERASRIVLEAAATVPSRAPSDREADRWPMQRTPVLDAASVAELRSGMDALTLPSGVEALGRAGVAPETGDAWFVGSTSHYTAAVRITSTTPADPLAAAQRASELFTAVLEPAAVSAIAATSQAARPLRRCPSKKSLCDMGGRWA